MDTVKLVKFVGIIAVVCGCSRLVPPPNHVDMIVSVNNDTQVVFKGFIPKAREIASFERDMYSINMVEVRNLDGNSGSEDLVWQIVDQSVYTTDKFESWDQIRNSIVYGEALPGFMVKAPPRELVAGTRYFAGVGLLGQQRDGTKQQVVSAQAVFRLQKDDSGNLKVIVE